MARLSRVVVAACLTLAASALQGARGQATQRVVPPSRAAVQWSYAPIVQKVAPAVVNVYASRTEKLARNPLFDDPFFQQFFGRDFAGQTRERVQKSLGSGVIVDPSGLVVTNQHVIEGMTQVKVAPCPTSANSRPRSSCATRVPTLRCCASRERRSAFPFFPSAIRTTCKSATSCLPWGSPFGVGQTGDARHRLGLGAHANRRLRLSILHSDRRLDQPGKFRRRARRSRRSARGHQHGDLFAFRRFEVGIGFAIPVNMVKVVVESAKSGSKSVRRPWLGAKLQTVTPEIAESLGLARPTGALVASLSEGGPATEAGIKRGDVILSIDGQPVDDPDAFGFRFATHSLGQSASVTVRRAANDVTLPIKLRTAPETPPRDLSKIEGLNPLSGVTLENLSPAVDEELSLDASSGVVIADVDDGSTAGRAGFQKGDILVEVNGAKITSPHDAQRVLADKQRLWKIVINRGGQILSTVFQG